MKKPEIDNTGIVVFFTCTLLCYINFKIYPFIRRKQHDCLSGKPCESSEDCQKSYHCIEGNCCKISTSGDAGELVCSSKHIKYQIFNLSKVYYTKRICDRHS